jgi:hypothetical protein
MTALVCQRLANPCHSRLGQRYRAAVHRGRLPLIEIVAAIGNRTISSLSDAH